MKTHLAMLLASLSFDLYAADNVSAYGPYNVDAGKEKCTSDSGTEIRKEQTFEATGDRFFKNFTVSKISGWAPKKAYREIFDVAEKEIDVESRDGYKVKVKVPYRYSVRAHADCGSGYGPVLRGETISIECEVNAQIVKYSND
ncbi:hypothetical protein [Massilia sp. CCM 8734]|uniref:hypothetical protein n=1 Tax=Massilia sp. CCM 8734 TaxID=2609283 RepID=UPI00141EDFD5|nr:hypothetical protein [Massilia sp. CCM 8734]NHZ96725.1 hypothetical protein [Massilia sp. CCM 8734]